MIQEKTIEQKLGAYKATVQDDATRDAVEAAVRALGRYLHFDVLQLVGDPIVYDIGGSAPWVLVSRTLAYIPLPGEDLAWKQPLGARLAVAEINGAYHGAIETCQGLTLLEHIASVRVVPEMLARAYVTEHYDIESVLFDVDRACDHQSTVNELRALAETSPLVVAYRE
ncbi:MAG TPA: hypothetical protein VJB66_03575 [Candidatus Nanoarchaeia archaeon]|nr:hypothetical protein [Candidatus Nanoarchaeia archaeon]